MVKKYLSNPKKIINVLGIILLLILMVACGAGPVSQAGNEQVMGINPIVFFFGLVIVCTFIGILLY